MRPVQLRASKLSPALSRGLSESSCLTEGQDRAGIGGEGPKNAANGGYQAPRTRPTAAFRTDSSDLLRMKPRRPAQTAASTWRASHYNGERRDRRSPPDEPVSLGRSRRPRGAVAVRRAA